MRRINLRLLSIFGIILIIISLVFHFITIATHHKVKKAKHWPSTKGTIIKSQGISPGSEFFVNAKEKIEYEYVVMGKTYQNDRISIGLGEDPGGRHFNNKIPEYTQFQLLSNSGPMVSAHFLFEVGSHHIVYYNKNNPMESYLWTKPTSTTRVIKWWGFILSITGFLLLLFSLKKTTPPSSIDPLL